jgi:hypothetical protein
MQLRTVAGSDGTGTATALAQQPYALAYRDGVLYSSDARGGWGDEHTVLRALDLATGQQRVLAGGTRPRTRGDGPAASLQLGRVDGVAVDPAGRVFASDQNPNGTGFLVRVDPDGTTTMPRVMEGQSPDALPSLVPVDHPGLLAAGPDGTVYVAGALSYDQVVAAVTPTHRTVVIGGGTAGGCAVGTATAVKLGQIYGVAVDGSGRVLVSANGCVRRLEPSGDLVRVAGGAPDGGATDPGRGDGGPATSARLDAHAIATDGADTYVVDEYHRVRRVAGDGTISTVAGNGVGRFPASGSAPLTPAQAGDGAVATQVPLDVLALAAGGGALYLVDGTRTRVVKNGVIGTVAGNGEAASGGDGGAAANAQVFQPTDVAVLPGGGYVVTTPYEPHVRKVGAGGVVSTLAGNGGWGETGDGGPATAATLNQPRVVAAGPDGSVYVGSWNTVRRIAPNGTITRFAGNATNDAAVDGVPATQSPVSVGGIDVGPDGTLYIASYGTSSVRHVRADGVIETVAGGNGSGYGGDNGPARLATFAGLIDIDVQPDGGYYLAEEGNNRIRYVSPGGIVTTVAGGAADSPAGTYDGDGDGGPALAAYLDSPRSVTATPDGGLYIGFGPTVREVRGGVIRTVAGRYEYSTDRKAGADVVSARREPLLGGGGMDAVPGGVLVPEYDANRVRLLLTDVVPSAPTPVTVTAASRRLVVRWTEPAGYGGSPVDSYTVTATPSDGGAPVTRTVPATERRTRLIGLRNGVDHTVTVRATNGAGAGAAATATGRPRAGLPGPPRYVAARAGDGSARIDWTRPEDGGGAIDTYRVTTLPGGATIDVPGGTTGTSGVTVGPLANGTAYRFAVAAHDATGWGEESPPTAPVVPSGAPDPPSMTVSGSLTGPEVVRFGEAVRDVHAGNVVLRDRATGGAVAVLLSCAGASGAAVSCAEDPLRSVTVRPRSPLTSGARYDFVVNPDGARPVSGLDGIAVPLTTAGLQGATTQQENTVGGRRLWRRVSDSHAEGGQYAVERLAGAAAFASVTGTHVTWLTALGPDMGRAELWVDGVRRATYDNHAAVRAWQVPRTVSGLTDAAHSVEVRVISGSVVVDSLGAPVRYEWRRVGANGAAYGVADLAGADTSLTFRGTGIAWYAVRGPGFGRVAVYIDGHHVADVDYYAATTTYGYRRAVTGLAAGVHTVRLVVLGTRSAAAKGTEFALDRWQVTA